MYHIHTVTVACLRFLFGGRDLNDTGLFETIHLINDHQISRRVIVVFGNVLRILRMYIMTVAINPGRVEKSNKNSGGVNCKRRAAKCME